MEGMVASSLTPSYAHSFLSQWGASSEQAGSAGTHSQRGWTMSTHCQRTSDRKRIQSRPLQWGNDHCIWFMNGTDSKNSTGRKRKTTGPPGHDHALKDGTASGPFNRSCWWAPEPSAAWVQHLPRQRKQSQSSQQGYDLCRRFVEIMDYQDSARRRRSCWRRSPPHCDQEPKGDTEGSSKASSKRATAPRAAQRQSLLRQREQGRSPQRGYDLRRRFVEITDHHQSARRRRKHTFGKNRQKRQRQN